MFSIMSIIFPIFFVVVLGIFVATFVRGAKQWHKNNNSPRLTVDAILVSKRTDVSHHHHHDNNGALTHTTHNTWYYATFEVESGDRMEFSIHGREYGMLMEGDRGRLTFQGTRYLSFDRI